MKLLQINVVVNSGSTGRIAEELGKLALKEGWESYIAFGREPSVSSSETIKIGSPLDMYKHVLETRLFDNHGFSSKKATRELIEKIKTIDPDIVHLHNLHGYYVHIRLLFDFLAQLGKPVVWTLHDCWPFTGHCAFYEYVGCEKWKKECHDCPQTHEYPKSWFRDNSRQNFRHKDEIFNSLPDLTLVPVSDWLVGQLKDSFLKRLPVKRIHNGIDLTRFTPDQEMSHSSAKDQIADKFVILGVANLWQEERKGLKDFCELAPLLENDQIIVLIGINKTHMKTLPENIIGIERTESVEDLAAWYALSNVFFNPTWEDNYPTTNLEALACGTPVITYDTGGSGEVITKETGFKIRKGDLIGALDAISLVKKNGKAYYRKACRTFAVNNLDKDQRFQEYFELYKELTEERRLHED